MTLMRNTLALLAIALGSAGCAPDPAADCAGWYAIAAARQAECIGRDVPLELAAQACDGFAYDEGEEEEAFLAVCMPFFERAGCEEVRAFEESRGSSRPEVLEACAGPWH